MTDDKYPDHRRAADTLSDEAIDWLVHLNSGKISESDRREFEAWRTSSQRHEAAFRDAESLWQDLCLLSAIPGNSAPQSRKGGRIRARFAPRSISWATAALVLLIAGGVWYSSAVDLLRFRFADYRTTAGEQQTVTLADGSTIRLNTNTGLNVVFSDRYRHVDLIEGEAVFLVAPDADRPFTVSSNGVTTKAVGTVFDVYKKQRDVVVTVLESQVQVSSTATGEKEPLMVHEGERVTYVPATGLGRVESVNLRTATAWQRGKLIFEARPLGDVIDELNRYRVGLILILDPALRQLKVTGVFEIGNPAEPLRMITRTLPVRTTSLTPYLVLLH